MACGRWKKALTNQLLRIYIEKSQLGCNVIDMALKGKLK